MGCDENRNIDDRLRELVEKATYPDLTRGKAWTLIRRAYSIGYKEGKRYGKKIGIRLGKIEEAER